MYIFVFFIALVDSNVSLHTVLCLPATNT